jgi:hypothetical protein
MEKNIIEKQVKRVCRNMIIILTLLGVLVGLVIIGTIDETKKSFGKDVGIKVHEKLFDNYLKGGIYATEKNAKILDTGYFIRDNEKSTEYYYVITVKYKDTKRYVLYKTTKKYTKKDAEKVNVKGLIKGLSTDDYKVYTKTINSLTTALNITSIEAAEYVSSSLIIDGTAGKLGTQIFGIGIILLGGIIVYFIVRQINFMKDYKKHKIYRKAEETLKREPEVIADKIETEINKDNLVLNKKNIKITDTYIVQKGIFTFNVRLKNDLIWAYYNETKHYTNGIPSGSTFTINLYFNKGPKDLITISVGNKKKTLAVIETLADKIDNVMFGYTDELKNLHDKNFKEFLNVVEDYKNNKHKKVDTEENK